MKKTRAIQHGLGPIGCACVRLIDEWDSLELVPSFVSQAHAVPPFE